MSAAEFAFPMRLSRGEVRHHIQHMSVASRAAGTQHDKFKSSRDGNDEMNSRSAAHTIHYELHERVRHK